MVEVDDAGRTLAGQDDEREGQAGTSVARSRSRSCPGGEAHHDCFSWGGRGHRGGRASASRADLTGGIACPTRGCDWIPRTNVPVLTGCRARDGACPRC